MHDLSQLLATIRALSELPPDPTMFPRASRDVHNFSNATTTRCCPIVAVVLPSLEIQKSKIVPRRENTERKVEMLKVLRPRQEQVAQGHFAYPLGSIGEG